MSEGGLLPPLVLELMARADKLYSEMRKVSAEVDKTAAQTKKSGKEIEDSVSGAGGKTEESTGRAAAGWSKLQGVGKAAALGLGGAALAVGVSSLKMAGDFQAQVTRLHTAAGESEQNLKSVGDGIMAIARSTGTSTEQLASGAYMVESAGFHGADALKVLTAAAQGAKNEGADLEGVGDALTTVMDDVGAKSGQAANLMSQMVAAVGQGKMKMDDLAGSIHSVLPNAAALGISFPQVAGALATMTAEGVSADQAAQNLNHTIVKLAAPTTAMSNAMAAYGVNSNDLKNNLGKNGLTGTMDILSKAILDHMGPSGLALMDTFNKSKVAGDDVQKMLKNLPPSIQTMAKGFLDGSVGAKDFAKAGKELGAGGSAQVAQFLKLAQTANGFSDALKSGKSDAQTFNQAMYSMLGDQTGLQVALHLTGDHMQTFKDNVDVISKASADANGNVKDWSVTQDTFNNRMSRLKETAQTAAIAIGEKLLPPVSAFVGFLANHQGVMIAFAAVITGVLVVAAGAWIGRMIYMSATTETGLLRMTAAGARWVAEQSGQLAAATGRWVAYGARWIAIQAASAAESVALWSMYAAQWLARQAAAAASWVASTAASVTSWVATQAVGFAQSAAAGAVWIAEHVAMAAAAVVQYGIMAAAATAAFIAENAASLGIGLAIAAVIAAVVWLATHWSEAWHAITQAASWAYDNVIKPVGGWIVGNVLHPIGSAVSWLSGIWSAEWRVVTQAVLWAYNSVIRPVGSWIMDNVLHPIGQAAQWLGDLWSRIWGGIGSAVQSAWNFIQPIVRSIQGAIGSVSSGISTVKSIGGGIGSMLGFDNGGRVPGALGAPMLAVVHGGEYVLSNEMQAGRQAVDDGLLSGARSANGYTPAAGGTGGPSISQLALSGSSPSSSSSGGGAPVVNVYAQTNADPHRIAAETGWVMRQMAST